MTERDTSYSEEDDTLSEQNKEVRDFLLLWLDYIMQFPENQKLILKIAQENDNKAFGRTTEKSLLSSPTKTLKDELP